MSLSPIVVEFNFDRVFSFTTVDGIFLDEDAPLAVGGRLFLTANLEDGAAKGFVRSDILMKFGVKLTTNQYHLKAN